MRFRGTGWTIGVIGMLVLAVFAPLGAAEDDLDQGGDRLVGTQNPDGGWGWPLTGASASNTVGPIAMGLGQAYWATNDPGMAAGLQKAGAFLLGKTTTFSAADGYLAAFLDGILGGTTYRNYVKANFYDKLSAGTYKGYTTASYVQAIRNGRSGAYANLAAWDIGMGLVGAAAVGAPTADWIGGVKAEINELQAGTQAASKWFDVIGLAGALYGLAFVGEEFDPTAGQHAAAGNLHDLANILASYQIAGGGFAWNANWVIPNDSDEQVQETAYAILALNAVDREAYLSAIQGAAAWLRGFQLANGGWMNSDGGSENNEVTGEALWGLHAFLVAHVYVDGTGKDTSFGTPFGPFRSIQKGIDTVNVGGTVTVGDGTYNGFEVWHPATIASVNGACKSTVTGNVSISSREVRLGGMGHGFTLPGNITVGAGVDASTIHINWNDLFGNVQNDGTGTLDATYNYWGTMDPGVVEVRTIGDINFAPLLPVGACSAQSQIEQLFGRGYHDTLDSALGLLTRATANGLSLLAYMEYLAAAAEGGGDPRPLPTGPDLLSPAGGGGSVLNNPIAGGGGSVAEGIPLSASYAQGEAIELSFLLQDPDTGEPVVDNAVTLTLLGLNADGTKTLYFWGLVSYDPATGLYTLSYDTVNLPPGNYVLVIQTSGGGVHEFGFTITAP